MTIHALLRIDSNWDLIRRLDCRVQVWMTPAFGSPRVGNGGLLAERPRRRFELFNEFLERSSGSDFAEEESSNAQAPLLEPDISQVKDIREVSEVFVASGLQI